MSEGQWVITQFVLLGVLLSTAAAAAADAATCEAMIERVEKQGYVTTMKGTDTER